MTTDCPHDLAERETACADGMCPKCLAIELGKGKAEELRLLRRIEQLIIEKHKLKEFIRWGEKEEIYEAWCKEQVLKEEDELESKSK